MPLAPNRANALASPLQQFEGRHLSINFCNESALTDQWPAFVANLLQDFCTRGRRVSGFKRRQRFRPVLRWIYVV
jgi:hypothetical protein